MFTSFLLAFVLGVLVIACHTVLWDGSRSFDCCLTRVWTSAYECGCVSGAHPASYFGFTYLSLLVFFVIFDLEVALLLNLPLQGTLYKSFWFYFVFLLVLSVGYSVEVNRGYADWDA